MRVIHLREVAEAEVGRILRELPEEVAGPMGHCAIRLLGRWQELEPGAGPEDELLGLFEGAPWGQVGEAGEGPPCITLFLETIWEESGGEMEAFCEEVRITLLHEIGHYLGWSEEEVEKRGLG